MTPPPTASSATMETDVSISDEAGMGNLYEALWREAEAEVDRLASGLRPSDEAIAQAFHDHRRETQPDLPPWSEVMEGSRIWKHSHNFAARLSSLPVSVPAAPASPPKAQSEGRERASLARRKRDAMAVWDGTHVAQDKRDLPKASPPLTPDGQSTSREGERS